MRIVGRFAQGKRLRVAFEYRATAAAFVRGRTAKQPLSESKQGQVQGNSQ